MSSQHAILDVDRRSDTPQVYSYGHTSTQRHAEICTQHVAAMAFLSRERCAALVFVTAGHKPTAARAHSPLPGPYKSRIANTRAGNARKQHAATANGPPRPPRRCCDPQLARRVARVALWHGKHARHSAAAVTWQPRGSHMAVTWQPRDSHVAVTRQSQGSHMAGTWPSRGARLQQQNERKTARRGRGRDPCTERMRGWV